MSLAPSDTGSASRRDEIRAFLFLAFVLGPLFAVMFVGGYGLVVWIWQMVAGPPGPPPA